MMWECFTCFDPHDKKSTVGTCEFFDTTSKYGLKKRLGRWDGKVTVNL